ncbi:glycine-rich domain-containing protein [Streptomyces chartreusis]|uniref:glycine-rich domain-containing protein n=1 Tax=Streptomyces chartreusis TaxID=1969 RepID=UPI002E1884DD
MAVCVDDQYFEVGDDGRLTLIPGQTGLRQVLYYKDPGTHSFNKASFPWLARVFIKVQAAGGGAAGARANANELTAHPGGAGGGYSERLVEASALGASETIVVGAGGAAGTATVDGGNGGNSSFGGICTANGGAGGQVRMNSGATPVCYSGTAGPLAGSGDVAQGGGAGGGSLRISGDQGQSGAGGESRLGHGGFQRSSTNSGGAGRGYGGGAAGAFARDGDSVAGTAGQDGIVILYLLG